MIEKLSNLKVTDNTGVKNISCIGSSKRSRRYNIKIGDKLIGSIRKVGTNCNYLRGTKVRALLIRRAKSINMNYYLKFQANNVILVSEQNNPLASRILGPIPRKLRALGWSKLFALGGIPI